MGLLALFVALAITLIVLELFKHHFTKELFKYIIIGVVLLFVLLMASAYWDLGEFFSQDNTFSKTGAVIADDVSEDIEKIDLSEIEVLETISEKTKEFFRDLLDK